jgi:hypothetical protein
MKQKTKKITSKDESEIIRNLPKACSDEATAVEFLTRMNSGLSGDMPGPSGSLTRDPGKDSVAQKQLAKVGRDTPPKAVHSNSKP